MLIAGLLLVAGTAPPGVLEHERLDKTAACLIRKERKRAADWAASDPGSPDEASGAERLAPVIAKCGGGGPPGPLADVVAGRLFNRYETSRIVLPGPLAERNHFANVVLDGASGLPRELAVLRCVALTQPEVAEAFVRTRFGSPAEAAARGSLAAVLADCTPAGERIGWTRLSLRLGLARAVYRFSPAALLARGRMGDFAEESARAR